MTIKKQIQKTLARQNKKHTFKKAVEKFFFYLFSPIRKYFEWKDKRSRQAWKELVFSKTKAEKYIKKHLFSLGDLDASDGSIFFSIYDSNWNSVLNNWRPLSTKKDYNFSVKFSKEIAEYIQNDFEIDGYVKINSETTSDEKYMKYFCSESDIEYMTKYPQYIKSLRSGNRNISVLFVPDGD